MTLKFVLFERVSHRYESMPEPLFEDLNFSLPRGWTGVVGQNGAGKSTLLKMACGILQPRAGCVQAPGNALYCEQRTDEPPSLLPSLIEATDGVASRVKGQLGIDSDWAIRWNSLSHGERKRAQIAVVLWQRPAVLAVDEPTNHIDAECRSMLRAALAGFDGIGLLVSHDRELLDDLCARCLFVDPPVVVLRPGNYSAGKTEALREENSARQRKEIAKREVQRLKVEARRRMVRAHESDHRRWKKGLAPKDHDGKSRVDLARLTGADGAAGKLVQRMQSRLEVAVHDAQSIRVRKRHVLGIWIEGERCRRDTLFRISGGFLPLGNGRQLRFPDLAMLPQDRIALTGSNGSGKSTLIRHIVTRLDLPPDRLTYLPQEIDARSARTILEDVRRQPPGTLGDIMTVVNRLGSRPERLLASGEPSPGELRKLLLGLGIALQPHLIIMDEPTNHLDLPSIECLERALEGCPCGLLLVSHDERFLDKLTRRRWKVRAADGESLGSMLLEVAP